MQLYSVTMDKLHKVTKYDSSGKVIEDRTDTLRITYSNMPHQTALNYRSQFPDANVVIEAQAMDSYRPVSKKKAEHWSKNSAKQAKAANSSSAQSAQQKINQAAASGDLAASINKAS